MVMTFSIIMIILFVLIKLLPLEVSVNIGTKPNGQGGVFPHGIQGSFINGGLKNVEEIIVESSIGRIAQILQKQNVGQSGVA